MRKLAFSSLGCPAWDFSVMTAQAAQLGFGAIEVRGCQEQLRTDRLPFFATSERARTQAALAKAGVCVCGVGTSCRLHEKKALWQEEAFAAIRLCTEWGIPFVRVFGDAVPAQEPLPQVLQRVETGLRALCAYARALAPAAPVQILLEVHGAFNTRERLVPLVQRLADEKAFGLIWDVEHSWSGEGKHWQNFYEALRPWICHVHLKDVALQNGVAVPCLPGEGVLPLAEIVHALEGDGYSGWFSFEWEKRWFETLAGPEQALPAFVKFMEKIEKGA